MNFLLLHWHDLGVKLWQQVMLVGVSTAVAIIIGVTFGIIFSRQAKLCHAVMSVAGIIQTIPSLALLTFLLPFLGIGIKPALTALILYALLPILRNTLIGLQSVPPPLKHAAIGLGFSRRQQLFWVELPLALPVIIAGIKTAVVINVGVATLAAFVGAGGLGDFINQGLALNNNALILLGAIPAAILALLFDGFLCLLAQVFASHAIVPARRNRKLAAIFLGFSVLVFLSWWWSQSGTPKTAAASTGVIRVATKNFSESIVLGEIIAQTIEHKTTLTVKRDFNLGSTDLCHQALLHQEIDLYPEYTGTAYLLILHGKERLASSKLFDYLSDVYRQQFQLTWLAPFGFNNTEALAVHSDFAKKHHLNQISDLVAIEQRLIAGVPSEFTMREDGLPGLQRVYHLQFGHIHEMAPALMYQALQQQSVNVISAFSTDGRIQADHLVLLTDDKHLFPPYDAAIVARSAILLEHPELKRALQLLSGLIDDQTMRDLNYRVDIEHQSPHDVARQFLQQKGMMTS